MEQKTRRYPRDLLGTACIPLDSACHLDRPRFEHLIQGLTDRGLTRIYTFGTAGEGHSVGNLLFAEVVSAFAELMRAPDLSPMVGVIALSAADVAGRIRFAYGKGIRDFQISLPPWGALSDQEVVDYFHLICDQFPDCRFMHYNTGRSGRRVGVSLYRRLCEEIQNLVAVKYITSDFSEINALKKADLPLRIYFTEFGFSYASMIGFDCGFLISLAACNIVAARRWLQVSDEGDLPALQKFHSQMTEISEHFAAVTDRGRIDSAYDKLFCRFLVPDFPQSLLPPYEGQSDPERSFQQFSLYLKEKHPEWLDAAAQ